MNLNTSVVEKLIIHTRESKYNGSLPFFYDDAKFPELEIVKENWELVWDEIRNYEEKHGNITGMNTYTPPEISGANSWNNIYLENFMWRFHNNRKKFPKTCSLISQIPNCTHLAISILSPQSNICAHYGDTNAVIRCHLGLHVPAPYPQCGLRVGTEERGWKNGGLTIFTEAHYHTSWNNTGQRRYLLVFDIIRPEWATKKYWVCSSVLGAQSFVYLEKKIPLFKKIPNVFLPVIHFSFSFLWRLYLPLQRASGFFYTTPK